jgi:hypothetical protein
MSEEVKMNPDDLVNNDDQFSGAFKSKDLVTKSKKDIIELRLRV